MKNKKEFLAQRYHYFNLLTPREQKILRLHYGFEGPALTLEEIGKEFEITGAAIWVVEQRAIEKLKKNTPS